VTSGMRALTVVTIVMGVMILAGTGVLVAVIAHRIVSPAPGSGQLPSGASAAGAAPVSLALDEPAGTHIAGVAAAGDRLAVQLQGGGSDRVVLVDPRSGIVTGRITLAR
jgi:hypothetical protein